MIPPFVGRGDRTASCPRQYLARPAGIRRCAYSGSLGADVRRCAGMVAFGRPSAETYMCPAEVAMLSRWTWTEGPMSKYFPARAPMSASSKAFKRISWYGRGTRQQRAGLGSRASLALAGGDALHRGTSDSE
jgi:hypothetical protein